MNKFKLFLKKYKKVFIGIIVGGVIGYLYYYFVGCSTGTCPLTSSPVNSVLVGMLLGGVLMYK